MRQFDICELKGGRVDFVVVLQHDATDELASRIVAPLSDRADQKLISRIRLPIDIAGASYVLEIDRMAAVAKAVLGRVVATAASEEHRIKAGIDFLLFGV